MVLVNHIANAIYGCIVGNWLLNLFQTFTHHSGGEHRYVVVAQLQTCEYIKVLETDDQIIAYDIEGKIDEDTNTITAITYDRVLPGDREDLRSIEFINIVPPYVEEREKLLAIMHEVKQYW